MTTDRQREEIFNSFYQLAEKYLEENSDGLDGTDDAYKMASFMAAHSEQGWVSVSERLPDFKGRTTECVPCEFYQENNERQFLGWYDPQTKQWLVAHPESNYRDIAVYDVTHWKEMSAPPVQPESEQERK